MNKEMMLESLADILDLEDITSIEIHDLANSSPFIRIEGIRGTEYQTEDIPVAVNSKIDDAIAELLQLLLIELGDLSAMRDRLLSSAPMDYNMAISYLMSFLSDDEDNEFKKGSK